MADSVQYGFIGLNPMMDSGKPMDEEGNEIKINRQNGQVVLSAELHQCKTMNYEQ